MATTHRPWHFIYFARFYMSMRECWLKDRRKEAQEEVVADLHSCLEQLTYRCTEMETKIQNCKQRALYHMQLAKKESGTVAIQREQARARMYMQDRKRLMAEHDKAARSMHMLQQQIDSIVSSHVDMVIVDAMRGFNATAARMGLPQKTSEIEQLTESLADRHLEAASLQEAMGGVWPASSNVDEGDHGLMQELENMMMPDPPPLAPEPAYEEETTPLLPSPPVLVQKPLIVEISSTPAYA